MKKANLAALRELSRSIKCWKSVLPVKAEPFDVGHLEQLLRAVLPLVVVVGPPSVCGARPVRDGGFGTPRSICAPEQNESVVATGYETLEPSPMEIAWYLIPDDPEPVIHPLVVAEVWLGSETD